MYLKNSEVKDGVAVAKVGESLGFKTGDKILELDGKKVVNFDEVPKKILFAKTVLVERNGATQKISLPVDLINKVLDGEESVVGLRVPFVVGKFADSSANAKILLPKDLIKSIDGKPTKYADQVTEITKANPKKR